jgi:tRNA dimethylallyltransferase
VLVIFGPTAAGKSALAHAVARALGAEIVVADPFQRYRGLEIAADAPRAAERAAVPYHLVADLDLTEDSSAGTYAPRAHALIDRLADAGGTPLLTGGTGLYIRAALTEMQMRPAPPDDVRRWAEGLVERDLRAAVAELEARDPAAAAAIDTDNPRRVVRALERVAMGDDADGGGDLWSEPLRRPAFVVGITRPREVVHHLIARRVRRELDEGLVPELQAALQHPGLARAPMQVIGMREVAAITAGEMRADGLEEALNVRTRRLARMQETWMRRMAPDVLIDLGDRPADGFAHEVVAHWRRARGGVG